MKSRDSAVRAKRFDADEKGRKAADIEVMMRDFELMSTDLERQIAAEEERTGVRDQNHFAYSTFAKAALLRRDNIRTTLVDLGAKLDNARREHDEAMAELRRVEAIDSRDLDRPRRKGERNGAQVT